MAAIGMRVVIGGYGFVMLLVAWQAWQAKQGNPLFNQLTALAAVLVLTAAVIPDKVNAVIVLLGLSAVAWLNGVAMYGKPHVRHHVVRLLVHLVLFGFAVWLL
ncbi:hypothetical protein [Lacticaseibacillus chiayiensis]|uniref:hypothetical protein n=1 Tax=Lacticaseibacillus chiayiensis TaxID=2100821 RepID=UPI0010127597|nr:hypothetical protein [Lacticaseibacillus chiayiensis]RXT56780.1 hypothetical protein CHT97_11040 [Lacticaseibacillus chiayiensis]